MEMCLWREKRLTYKGGIVEMTGGVQGCEHRGPQTPGDHVGPRKPQRPLSGIQLILLGHS